jgi:hypothetical protein
MADPITLYSVDNTKDYLVIAQSGCSQITVKENASTLAPPTQDLLQKLAQVPGTNPVMSTNPATIIKGGAAVYTPSGTGGGRYQAGDIVGTIRTVSGSITVQQVEALIL